MSTPKKYSSFEKMVTVVLVVFIIGSALDTSLKHIRIDSCIHECASKRSVPVNPKQSEDYCICAPVDTIFVIHKAK